MHSMRSRLLARQRQIEENRKRMQEKQREIQEEKKKQAQNSQVSKVESKNSPSVLRNAMQNQIARSVEHNARMKAQQSLVKQQNAAALAALKQSNNSTQTNDASPKPIHTKVESKPANTTTQKPAVKNVSEKRNIPKPTPITNTKTVVQNSKVGTNKFSNTKRMETIQSELSKQNKQFSMMHNKTGNFNIAGSKTHGGPEKKPEPITMKVTEKKALPVSKPSKPVVRAPPANVQKQQPTIVKPPLPSRQPTSAPVKAPTQVKTQKKTQTPTKQSPKPRKEHKFVFIMPSYNNEQNYKKNLDSVVNQTYKHWRIIYVDDASTDNTYQQVNYYVMGNQLLDRVTILRNHKNMKQAYSRYIAFQMCEDDEICCLLDGDDWLHDVDVLRKLNDLYNSKDILVTYGGMCNYQNGKQSTMQRVPDYNKREIDNKMYRNSHWRCYPLRTGYASLFKSCPIEQLKDHNGEWLKCSTDMAIMYHVLEQSNGKHMKIDFPTYVYNVDNSKKYDNSFYTKDDTWKEYRKLVDKRLKGFGKSDKLGDSVKETKEIINVDKTTLLGELTFTNETQKKFYDYLKEHNIGQIVISPSLQHFNRIKTIYGLQDYTHDNAPCLYFGVYNEREILPIKNHKGKVYVMFGGTDCDTRVPISIKTIEELKKLNNIDYIAQSKNIESRLIEQNIECIYLHLNLVNHNIFKPINTEKERKCIYVYDGQGSMTNTKKMIYNHKLIEEVKRKLPEYEYIHSSSLRQIPYEQMPSVYKKCFIGLRLTEKDGNANTVQEFQAMNIPIVHNHSEYGLKWKTVDDVIEYINNIYINIIYIAENFIKSSFDILKESIYKFKKYTNNKLFIRLLYRDANNTTIDTINKLLKNISNNYIVEVGVNDNKIEQLCKHSDIGIIIEDESITNLYNKFNLLIINNISNIDKLLYNNNFTIFIPHCPQYKQYIHTCAKSILNQTYNKYQILIINDGDNNFNYKYNNTEIVSLNVNKGPGHSKYYLIKHLQENYNRYNNEDIIMIIDGDDYLTTSVTLLLINLYYNTNNCLMTCGNYYGKWNDNIYKTKDFLNIDNIRESGQFFFPPIRTFKYKLAKYLDKEDFMLNKNFIEKCTDMCLFYRLFELSKSDNISIIYKKMYYYREHINCSYKKTPHDRKIEIVNHIKNLYKSPKIVVKDSKSSSQKTFINFLDTNNIQKCYISRSLVHFNRLLYIYNLDIYNANCDNEKNTLFFGLFNEEDFKILNNHKGGKYIVYAGTDCNQDYKHRYNNVINIKNNNLDAIYVSTSDCIYNRLINIYDIKKKNIVQLVNDLIDYNIFHSKQVNNNNSTIFIYDGNKKSCPKIYNKVLCDEIEEELQNKYNIIRTSKLETKIMYNDMFEFYKQFFICLRLTHKDGGSETTKEFKQIGKPIVHNNSDYGLKWNNKNDVIKHIENISKNIDKTTIYITITENISQDAYTLLENTLSELYDDGHKNIKLYMDKNHSYISDKELTIYDINNIEHEHSKKIEYNHYLYKSILLSDIHINCTNDLYGSIEKFKDIEYKFLQTNKPKQFYEKNTLYNIIIRKLFEIKNYTKNKFSIIIPLYNAESTIIDTLESIYSSDTINIDFEVIIVNDCSTDNSVEVINSYICKNDIKNIIILENQQNYGTYISRNRGIFESNGQFIFILDSDDAITNDRFRNEFEIFKKNTNIQCINSLLMKYDQCSNGDITVCDNFKEAYNKYGGKYKEISVTYRREFFIYNGFFVNNRFGSDSEFFYNKVKKQKPFKINKVHYIAYYHETKTNNLTKTISQNKRNNFVKYYTICYENNISLKNRIII